MIQADEDKQQAPSGRRSLIELVVRVLEISFAIALIVIAGYIVLKLRKMSFAAKSNQPAIIFEASLRRQFEVACKENNLSHALTLLYPWLDNYSGMNFTGSIQHCLTRTNQLQLRTVFQNIMRNVYSPHRGDEIDLKSFASHFITEIKIGDGGMRRFKVELRLN